MNDEDALRSTEQLRSSFDETAKYVISVYITYLLSAVYIAVAIASTTDKQLLLGSNLPLPLLAVEIPIRGFYIFVPFSFLLFHLYLLLHIYFLSRKLADFEETVLTLQDSRKRQQQRSLLFPFALTPLSIQMTRSHVIRWVLRAVIWGSAVATPPLLLAFAELRFLPYHSVPITGWHRALFALDLAVLWLFWRLILECQPKDHESSWSRRSKIVRHLGTGAVCTMIVTSLVFLLVVATVPGELLDGAGDYSTG